MRNTEHETPGLSNIRRTNLRGHLFLLGMYEIRTYADGWVESYFGDGLNRGYYFDSKKPV